MGVQGRFLTCSDLLLWGHLVEWEELSFRVLELGIGQGPQMALRVLLLAQLLPVKQEGAGPVLLP